MARSPDSERPYNREVENEMIGLPERNGEPPRAATEPPQPDTKRPRPTEEPYVKTGKLTALVNKLRAFKLRRK